MQERLLTISDLSVRFPGRRSSEREVNAVNGVNLHLDPGETLGLVGESGSGKSTIGNAILGLVRPTAGTILFRGRDITHSTPRDRQNLGRHIQVIFQDPYSSLNPVRTIGQTLTEPLTVVAGMRRRQAIARAVEMLENVGLPSDAVHRYPAAFSGGQRQRIAVARALVVGPELVICDEPTSALDLSIQAQILNLLLDLQAQLGLTYLFISHDIDVVRHMSHRTAVLLKGQVVEHGATEEVVDYPTHEYTRALIAAVPVAEAPTVQPPEPAQSNTRRSAGPAAQNDE